MNYRHAFHAGNFADVFKHVVLGSVVDHLRKKYTPYLYLDTHAGAGVYDLSRSAAQRSGEYLDGIARLLAHGARFQAPEIESYIDVVKRSAGAGRSPITAYPGSPLIALAGRRPQDRAVLVESDPAAADALRRAVSGIPRVAVVVGDGYRELLAHVPPVERRGVVLIDPPFETEQEFDRVLEALAAAYTRWPTGIYAVWYPLTARSGNERFRRALETSGMRRVLDVRLAVMPLDTPLGMPGCGIALVNPPWQLDERLRALLPELHALLAIDGGGDTAVDWLVGE
jgi:23S rRNA (adenine2030-N6)-methyltransferase